MHFSACKWIHFATITKPSNLHLIDRLQNAWLQFLYSSLHVLVRISNNKQGGQIITKDTLFYTKYKAQLTIKLRPEGVERPIAHLHQR